jgi:hypothetical protein
MAPENDILDPSGSFKWDFLQCKDLAYPSPGNFKTHHVYGDGYVLLRHATALEVHGMCVERDYKKADEPVSGRDLNLLTSAGLVVQTVTDDAAFIAARSAYHAESARREADFKVALFAREGLTDNPKVEACYSKAYERSHATGLADVANTFIDLADLIR